VGGGKEGSEGFLKDLGREMRETGLQGRKRPGGAAAAADEPPAVRTEKVCVPFWHSEMENGNGRNIKGKEGRAI
jgi:hypothetical protein